MCARALSGFGLISACVPSNISRIFASSYTHSRVVLLSARGLNKNKFAVHIQKASFNLIKCFSNAIYSKGRMSARARFSIFICVLLNCAISCVFAKCISKYEHEKDFVTLSWWAPAVSIVARVNIFGFGCAKFILSIYMHRKKVVLSHALYIKEKKTLSCLYLFILVYMMLYICGDRQQRGYRFYMNMRCGRVQKNTMVVIYMYEYI